MCLHLHGNSALALSFSFCHGHALLAELVFLS
jgi:hypothetical protein